MKPLALVAATLLALPLAAQAQGWNPSSDELVQMLKPRAGGPTRGIRAMGAPAPAEPAPAAAPQHVAAGHVPAPRPPRAAVPAAVAPAAAAAPAESNGLAAVNLTAQFETGSDRLTPQAMRTLDVLGKALTNPDLAGYKFRIEGHTDAVGTPQANEALSQRRAAAALEYVVSHYGVDRTRLTAVGLGQTQMLVPTAEGVSEPRNRRVQVVNLGA